MPFLLPNQQRQSTEGTLSVSWKKYGKHTFFVEVLGRKNGVCFQDFCSYLVSDAWYCSDDDDDTSSEKSKRSSYTYMSPDKRDGIQ